MPVIPNVIPNLNDARWRMNGMLLWVVSAMISRNTTLHSPHIPGIKKMLNQWASAFQTFEDNSPIRRAKLIHCTQLLKVHHRVLSIMVNAFPYETETVFDLYTKDFESIVSEMGRLVLKELAQSNEQSRLSEYHLGAIQGYIPPLFLTVTRCRDPDIRRKALDMLRMLNRSEGGWDSCVAARIAEQVVLIEEKNSVNARCASDVSESSRIRLQRAQLLGEVDGTIVTVSLTFKRMRISHSAITDCDSFVCRDVKAQLRLCG